MLSLKHKLKDGRVVEIVPLSEKIPVNGLLDYINGLIEEDGYLQHNKKLTLKEEKKWKRGCIKQIKKKEAIYFTAIYEGRIVGGCNAQKEMGRGSDNVFIGIGVSKDFRRAGLGEFLMWKTIAATKKKLKPRNIYLCVAAPNKRARKLYGKLGFKEFARHPKWWKYKGKEIDIIWMLLK